MKPTNLFIIILIVASFILSIYFYDKLPDRIVSHWGFQGEPNGSMPKFWGLFLLPLMTLAITLLLVFIPRLDPLKENIKKSLGYYHGFIVVFVAFMLFLQLQIILWNIGIQLSMNFFIPISLGILFFYIGVMCSHVKRNWFIGIRTPWTLSSEIVWDKTHKVGGKLFKISGIFSVLGIFFGKLALVFVLIPVIFSALYTVIYSYVQYRRLKVKKIIKQL
jgi:uncharacterized membrane protein